MSLAIRAFFIALFAVIKRWKIVFFFFLFNFMFSLFLGIPIFKAISSQGGRYGGFEDFIKVFDAGLLVDFLSTNSDLIDNFFLTVGMGGVIYFFIVQILTGGMISILADPRENTSLKTFFKATGNFAFRFTRLLFYFCIALVVLSLLNFALNSLVSWLLNSYESKSSTLGWIMLSKNLLMILLTAYLLVSMNYAKTSVVVEGRHFMASSFVRGLGFALAHPLVTGLFFILATAAMVAAIFAYYFLSRLIDLNGSVHILDSIGGVTISGALLAFILFQTIQILIHTCLVIRHAGQVYIYKYLTVRTSNIDPELNSTDPFSPFIPDRPYDTSQKKDNGAKKEDPKNG